MIPPNLANRAPIASVLEADIDLALLVELHASPEFQRRFLRAVLGEAHGRFLGAWRSVFRLNGETDILILAEAIGGPAAVLVEDKIDASFQPMQAMRYRARGQAGTAAGDWVDFRTCLFGPELFVAPYRSSDEWDVVISFEEAADWLTASALESPRAAIIRSVLLAACQKFKKGGFVPSEQATNFWRQYQDLCLSEFPELALVPLRPVQSANDPWPRFKPNGVPEEILLQQKAWLGRVDLTFNKTPIEVVRSQFRGLQAHGYTVVKAGGSTAIRASVPVLTFLEPFETQIESVRAGLKAARALADTYRAYVDEGEKLGPT